MSNLQQFFGPPAITSIQGYGESTAQTNFGVNPNTTPWRAYNNLGISATGALTASTYKSIINVTGSGNLHFLALQNDGNSARTWIIRTTIDGVVVSTRTMASVDLLNRTLVAFGALDSAGSSGTSAVSFTNVRFNKSLLIEVQCSTTEASSVSSVLFNYTLT